jgi:glutamate transport system substrate-binding protein
MKAIIGMLSGALLLSAALSVEAQTVADQNATATRLTKSGTLNVGIKFDQPLFGQRDLSGKPIGFDVEIAQIIAAKLGIKPSGIRWVEVVSANREPFLEQGKVDIVVATFAITESRKKVVGFAGPYIITGQDIMVKKGNPQHINGPDDLAGKKVCVLNGSVGRQTMMERYPKANLIAFDAFSKCAQAVKNGSVDAATITGAILLGYVSKEPDQLEILGKPFTVEKLAIGIRKGDAGFCKVIDQSLVEAAADGRYKSAYDRTLGKFLKEPVKLPPAESCDG